MNIKNPKVFIPLSLGLIILFMLFLVGFGVEVPSFVFMLFFVVLAISAIVLVILLWKDKPEEPMNLAINFCENWIDKRFHQKIQTKGSQGYMRVYPPDSTEFYGFTFDRLDAGRLGQPIAIVLKRSGRNFTVAKYKELADGSHIEDPFVILGTKYAGAPVPNISSEPWAMPFTSKGLGKEAGIVVNVGDKEKDEWTEKK